MKDALSTLLRKVLSQARHKLNIFFSASVPPICPLSSSLPLFLPSLSPHTLYHYINVHLFSPSARCQAVQAENVTVLEGGTAQISCRLQNYDGSIVVIQNPRRQTLFFNGTRGVYPRAHSSLQTNLIHLCLCILPSVPL